MKVETSVLTRKINGRVHFASTFHVLQVYVNDLEDINTLVAHTVEYSVYEYLVP